MNDKTYLKPGQGIEIYNVFTNGIGEYQEKVYKNVYREPV